MFDIYSHQIGFDIDMCSCLLVIQPLTRPDLTYTCVRVCLLSNLSLDRIWYTRVRVCLLSNLSLDRIWYTHVSVFVFYPTSQQTGFDMHMSSCLLCIRPLINPDMIYTCDHVWDLSKPVSTSTCAHSRVYLKFVWFCKNKRLFHTYIYCLI